MQAGDVPATYADIARAARFGIHADDTDRVGLPRFVDWFRAPIIMSKGAARE